MTSASALPLKTDNYIWVDKFGRRFCNKPNAWHPHGEWVVHLERSPVYPGFSRVPSYLVFDETSMRAGSIYGRTYSVGGGNLGGGVCVWPHRREECG